MPFGALAGALAAGRTRFRSSTPKDKGRRGPRPIRGRRPKSLSDRVTDPTSRAAIKRSEARRRGGSSLQRLSRALQVKSRRGKATVKNPSRPTKTAGPMGPTPSKSSPKPKRRITTGSAPKRKLYTPRKPRTSGGYLWGSTTGRGSKRRASAAGSATKSRARARRRSGLGRRNRRGGNR